MDNYLFHLLAVQLICDRQWWLAESSEWWKSTEMWKRCPKSLKNEKLIFKLCSNSDDWPSDPSNKSWSKCIKGPLSHQKIKYSVLDYVQLLKISWGSWVTKVDWDVKKGLLSHHKMKCSFLDYVQLLMIGHAIQATKVSWNAEKGPLSHWKMKYSFLYYVQFLMISQAIWVMKVDQNAKNEMLFQLGSSVVSVWVFCCFSLGLPYTPL